MSWWHCSLQQMISPLINRSEGTQRLYLGVIYIYIYEADQGMEAQQNKRTNGAYSWPTLYKNHCKYNADEVLQIRRSGDHECGVKVTKSLFGFLFLCNNLLLHQC